MRWAFFIAVLANSLLNFAQPQLICQRAITRNGRSISTPMNVTCNADELCGRIEGIVNGLSGSVPFVGTNCYSSLSCLSVPFSSVLCETTARTDLSITILPTETVTDCRSGCCSENVCNANLTLNGSITTRPCFLMISALLLVLIALSFHHY